MRYKRQYPKKGDCRIVSFFAWFPVWIPSETDSEWRWLEVVTVEQGAFGTTMFGEPPIPQSYRWVNVRFVDKEPSND